MKNISHKEKLEHWKKYDPIHYSEMTSDPTGIGSGSICEDVLAVVLGVLISIGLFYFLTN